MPLEENPCIEFGQRLRLLRTSRGLSQEELANAADLDRTYISSCEAGRRNVTLKTIMRLAEALGVDPSVFVQRPAEQAAESSGPWNGTAR